MAPETTGDKILLEAALIGFEQMRRNIEEKITGIRKILGTISAGAPAPAVGRRGMLSAAARARIAAAQRQRWALAKAKQAAPKRTMSAEARKKIAATLRKRWAAVKKAQAKKTAKASTTKTAPLK